MRRSRAYILTEIMMSMLLQAMFIVVLSGAFYMMLSFYTKTQQLQTARERGHRVISYVDQRIKHAGLGLWNCKTSTAIHSMFKDDTPMGIDAYGINLPLSVISENISGINYYASKDQDGGYSTSGISSGGKIFRGNIVTILYAYRDYNNSAKLILKSGDVISASPTAGHVLFGNIADTGFKYDVSSHQDASGMFSITESTGLPLRNSPGNNTDTMSFKIDNETARIQGRIYAGGELLHMGCERMFVTYNDNPEERSFAFVFPTKETNSAHGYKWGQINHHVAGILDIYMELHAPSDDVKTFDLYVLSTGGKDDSRTAKTRPASWPPQAHWDNEYGKYVLYVSRASWKLNNIPKDFAFNQ